MKIVRTNDSNKRSIHLIHCLRFGKQQGGQALIEVALTVPLLMTLLLGAVELGRVAYAAIEVSNAAAAAVAYGTQTTTTASDTIGIANAASSDAAELVGLATRSSYSCICSDGSPSTCSKTDCSTSNIEEILSVQTQATVSSPIFLPGIPTSFTLRGQAVQKVLP